MKIHPSLSRSLVTGLILLLGATALAQETRKTKVPVLIQLVETGPDDSGEPDLVQRKLPYASVKIAGQEKPILLKALVDTCLLNKSEKPQQDAPNLQIRDNRFHQALIKFDLSPLPAGSQIESAQIHVYAGWREREGNAQVAFHQMLSDWAPDATWFKPFPEIDDPWNGMAKGRHYEEEPFGNWEMEEVKPGWITSGDAAPLFADWASGKQPNYGVVLQFSGKAVQLNLNSSEAKPAKVSLRDIPVPSDGSARLKVTLDLGVVRRTLLSGQDLRGAELRLRKVGKGDLGVISVTGADIPGLQARMEPDAVAITGLADFLMKPLLAGADRVEFLLDLTGSIATTLGGPDQQAKERKPEFTLEHPAYENSLIFEHAVKQQPGVYTTVKEGHLYYGDKRLRIWGSLGYGDVGRLQRMGFNGWRQWPTLEKAYGEESVATGEFPPAHAGDGSEQDKADRMFSELKKHGFFVMATQLMGSMPVDLLTRDGSFVTGGADWEEWRAAVKQKDLRVNLVRFIDERLTQARKQHMKNVLTRVNLYTGKRLAEDEAVAIWELDNEVCFVKRMMDGEYSVWPDYFKKKLAGRWNDWLIKRYGTEEKLRSAWGKLDAGESWGNVQVGPDAKSAKHFPAARAQDFVRFIIETGDAYYQDLKAFARTHAPAGVGVAVAPFSFDTQYRPSVPWIYSQTRSDVANFGMYFWGLKSALDAPPSAYVMDNHTVEGKPTVIYETNQGRPSPYRAEFPYKLAAMASWQDWDAIFFHYWAGADTRNDEEFMANPLPHLTTSHYWTGVHHESDPIMTSAMAVAGRMFLAEAIQPAQNPAVYRVGGRGIFSYDLANGLGMGRDTFSRGSRIRFEPEADFKLKVEGGAPQGQISEAVQAGEEITWDWPKGRLIIDAPAAKAFVGPVPTEPWTFRDGVKLSGLSTPWVAFGLASKQGPLATADRAYISAVFDARNTGFEFDWNVSGGPVEQAKAIRDRGRAPVLVDRVDYTLSFPWQGPWTFQGYDFGLRKIARQEGIGNVLRLRNAEAGAGDQVVLANAPQEVWAGVIEFAKRTGSAPAVADPNTGARQQVTVGGTSNAEATDPKLAGIWNPIPGVSWGDRYARAHRILRESPIPSTSVTPIEQDTSGKRVITWSDAEAVLDAPAAIELSFQEGVMKRIGVTFVRPPDFGAAVAAYEERFGAPVEKKIVQHQYEQSSVRWLVKGQPATLEILMTDAQGTVKIGYELK